VAFDSAGNIFIADTLNNRIREVNRASGVITTIAGNGTAGYSGDGGQATALKLNIPMAWPWMAMGNLSFADLYNDRIREGMFPRA